MHKHKILVTEPIPESALTLLRKAGEVTVGDKGAYNNEENLIRDVGEFDALLCMLSTPVTEKVLQSANKLRIVANFAVGYNNIDVAAAHKMGIRVANTPGVLTEACGDFAMGLLLALSRRFNDAEIYLRAGKFKGWEPLGFLGMELRGKTLGIIGMGRIGQALANRAIAFGMNIAYHNRTRLPEDIEKKLNANYVEDHLELARMSDVVSLNCPLTDETHHLVNEEFMAAMQPHALLINIARGAVVDEAALAKALHNHTIAGAGLDVYEFEPEIHPDLLTAPNALLLPHIASATFETRDAIGQLAAQAIISVLEGKDPSEIPNLIA